MLINKKEESLMITSQVLNTRMDVPTRNILVNATMEEILNPGMKFPGGLISHRNREKTVIIKIKAGDGSVERSGEGEGEVRLGLGCKLAKIDTLFDELADTLRKFGKAYFPLHSRFKNQTLVNCNSLTVVSECVPVFEITLTLDPLKNTVLQMDPNNKSFDPNEFSPLTSEEISFIKKNQPWTASNAKIAFNNDCSWIKFEYITKEAIPLEDRVVVSNGKTVSSVIGSRANLIIAI